MGPPDDTMTASFERHHKKLLFTAWSPAANRCSITGSSSLVKGDCSSDSHKSAAHSAGCETKHVNSRAACGVSRFRSTAMECALAASSSESKIRRASRTCASTQPAGGATNSMVITLETIGVASPVHGNSLSVPGKTGSPARFLRTLPLTTYSRNLPGPRNLTHSFSVRSKENGYESSIVGGPTSPGP